jgi:hypothetical protein
MTGYHNNLAQIKGWDLWKSGQAADKEYAKIKPLQKSA